MMSRSTDRIMAARAAAVFSSDLSVWGQPTLERVEAAIRHAVSAHGGVRGCAAEVAAAYGEHPETAVPRMRWARQIVEGLYVHGGLVVDGDGRNLQAVRASSRPAATAA